MTRAPGQLDQISEAIGAMSAKIENLQQSFTKLEKTVEDLDRLTAKGAGVLVGLSIASGLVGSKIGAILHGFGKLVS